MVEGNGDLVGIVTGRDTRFEDDDSKEIRHVMTGNDRTVTVHETAESEEILQLMHKHRIEKITVVDDAHKLKV